MTGGTAVIDRFTDTFARYIDSGFGLVHGEVAWLASTLIAIDVTLAGLFWALSAEGEDVIARLIRKTLFIGAFAFLITNWSSLAQVVFQSFAGLGLKAGGGGVGADQLLHPGKLAQVGIDAGKPILTVVQTFSSFAGFFSHFVQIVIPLISWLIVIVSFFVLAIQLFVVLIEFKLTTLAGFLLVPFGLFSRTAFVAERTLGNVLASGIKVLVMAIIVAIGSSLFGEFTQGFPADPSIEDALTLVLASLTLLALGIFGPGIAAGLGSGAPQLGAGAAVGTGLAVGGLAAAGVAGVRAIAGVAGQGAAAIGGAVMPGGRAGSGGGAAAAGGGSGPSGSGSPGSGSPGPNGGPSPLRPGPSSAAAKPAGSAEKGEASEGAKAAGGQATGSAKGGGAAGSAGKEKDAARGAGAASTGGSSGGQPGSGETSDPGRGADASQAPGWARALQRRQSVHQGLGAAAHAIRSGDHHGGGAQLDLSQE